MLAWGAEGFSSSRTARIASRRPAPIFVASLQSRETPGPNRPLADKLIRQSVRSLMPLANEESDDFLGRVANTINGTIRGTLVISFLQGTLGALIFWWLDLPTPLLWGLVLAVLATIPTVGTFVVWGPTAIALVFQDQWGKAIILVVWEVVAVGAIDNVAFPMVIGTHVRMHTLTVFFAIMGGLLDGDAAPREVEQRKC
jgi:predicted PurR-regulated permease PerM